MKTLNHKDDPDYFHGLACVPIYLISAYLYDQLADTVITDSEFDELCIHLHDNWDFIDHPHKCFIDFDSLRSSTVSYMDFNNLPDRIKNSADHISKHGLKRLK